MNSRIILVGGAPTVGKSTLAEKLSREYDIPWISTDEIRDKVKKEKIRESEKYPKLFYFDNIGAEEYFSTHSPIQVVEDQNQESKEIWHEIEKFIVQNYDKPYIIEGIAIVPEFVKKLQKKYTNIEPLFLFNEDAEKIRKIVFERGLWDEPECYPDSVKEKEVEWVLEYNHWLKNEVKKYGFTN